MARATSISTFPARYQSLPLPSLRYCGTYRREPRGCGFRRVAIFNTHGGNSSLVDVMARDLRAEFGMRTFTIFGSAGATFEGLHPQERTYGFHAGELETAFLLATHAQLVDTSAYTANYIASIEHKPLLAPENGAANFASATRGIAASGVIGDPRPATAENGELWLNAAANRIAAVLHEILEFR